MEQDIQRRKTRKFLAGGWKIWLSALLFILTALFILLAVNMRTAMSDLAEARIKSVAARAMNDAILECMNSQESYHDLIEVHDNGSSVYLLQADTRGMNLLAATCSEAAQTHIAQIGELGVSVPLGTITGISFFAGRGPSIRITFTPIGSVQSAFNSQFLSAGINQTLYRVNLRLTASIRLVLPGSSRTIQSQTEAAIAENVLVGNVPQVYTDVDDEEDMLNLIPTELP